MKRLIEKLVACYFMLCVVGLPAQTIVIKHKTMVSGITPIGGACNDIGGAAGTLTISYSPTAGNTVVIGVDSFAGTPSLSDNKSTVYASLASNSNATLYGYIGVPSGITTYSITGITYSSACVYEYSGVVHFGSIPVTYTHLYASSYTATLSSTTGANNYLIAAVGAGYNNTYTASTGTIRISHNRSGGGTSMAIQDNTTASSGASITVAGTATGTSILLAGIEMKSQ